MQTISFASMFKLHKSPPFSSTAVKHGPYLPTLKKGSRLLEPSARGNFSLSPTWSTRPMTGCGARSASLWVHKSGNCQEMETCMVRACHMPRQPLKNHPSGHREGWVTLWSAVEMLDGQHQRVDISAYARTAHQGLLQKRLEKDLCWVVPHVPPTTHSGKGLNWTETISFTDYSSFIIHVLCFHHCCHHFCMSRDVSVVIESM